MKLLDYTKSHGGQTELAKKLGVVVVVINQWAHGTRPIPAHHCIAIEQATNGAVRCEELRPDIDWGYLRKTDARAAA